MSPPSSKFSQASQVQNVLLRNDLEEEEGVCYVVPATVRSRLGAAALRKPAQVASTSLWQRLCRVFILASIRFRRKRSSKIF